MLILAHLTEDCIDYAKAALRIYKNIKEEFQVTLLADIITERELLRIRLNAEHVELADIDEIIVRWRGNVL